MEAAIVAEFGALERYEGLLTAGRTDRAIVKDLFTWHNVDADDHTVTRFISSYLSRLPQELAARKGLVLPGVAYLLDTLKARDDVALGLLTGNYREGARLKLGYHGLYEYFDFGGFGDLHLDRDDVAREALAEVHRRFNGSIASDKLWVIGDTPADVRCARAIGAKVIAVATGAYTEDQLRPTNPDYLFPNFANPEPMLALLTR